MKIDSLEILINSLISSYLIVRISPSIGIYYIRILVKFKMLSGLTDHLVSSQVLNVCYRTLIYFYDRNKYFSFFSHLCVQQTQLF